MCQPLITITSAPADTGLTVQPPRDRVPGKWLWYLSICTRTATARQQAMLYREVGSGVPCNCICKSLDSLKRWKAVSSCVHLSSKLKAVLCRKLYPSCASFDQFFRQARTAKCAYWMILEIAFWIVASTLFPEKGLFQTFKICFNCNLQVGNLF